MQPFGTSLDVEASCFPNEFDRLRMCLACIILGKRMAMAIYLYSIAEKDDEDHQTKGQESKDLILEDGRTCFGFG
jgi:hypothetical protein